MKNDLHKYDILFKKMQFISFSQNLKRCSIKQFMRYEWVVVSILSNVSLACHKIWSWSDILFYPSHIWSMILSSFQECPKFDTFTILLVNAMLGFRIYIDDSLSKMSTVKILSKAALAKEILKTSALISSLPSVVITYHKS